MSTAWAFIAPVFASDPSADSHRCERLRCTQGSSEPTSSSEASGSNTLFDSYTAEIKDSNAKTFVLQSCIRCRTNGSITECELYNARLQPTKDDASLHRNPTPQKKRPATEMAAIASNPVEPSPTISQKTTDASAHNLEVRTPSKRARLNDPRDASMTDRSLSLATTPLLATTKSPAPELLSQLQCSDGSNIFDNLDTSQQAMLRSVVTGFRQAEARGYQKAKQKYAKLPNPQRFVTEIDRLRAEKERISNEKTADRIQWQQRERQFEVEKASLKHQVELLTVRVRDADAARLVAEKDRSDAMRDRLEEFADRTDSENDLDTAMEDVANGPSV